jgi:hypothetical protein
MIGPMRSFSFDFVVTGNRRNETEPRLSVGLPFLLASLLAVAV